MTGEDRLGEGGEGFAAVVVVGQAEFLVPECPVAAEPAADVQPRLIA